MSIRMYNSEIFDRFFVPDAFHLDEFQYKYGSDELEASARWTEKHFPEPAVPVPLNERELKNIMPAGFSFAEHVCLAPNWPPSGPCKTQQRMRYFRHFPASGMNVQISEANFSNETKVRISLNAPVKRKTIWTHLQRARHGFLPKDGIASKNGQKV